MLLHFSQFLPTFWPQHNQLSAVDPPGWNESPGATQVEAGGVDFGSQLELAKKFDAIRQKRRERLESAETDPPRGSTGPNPPPQREPSLGADGKKRWHMRGRRTSVEALIRSDTSYVVEDQVRCGQ